MPYPGRLRWSADGNHRAGAIAFGAVVLLAAYLFGTALGAIAKTALYVYATEQDQPEAFRNVDFSRTH